MEKKVLSEEELTERYLNLKSDANEICWIILEERPDIASAIQNLGGPKSSPIYLELAEVTDDCSDVYYQYRLLMNVGFYPMYRARRIYISIATINKTGGIKCLNLTQFENRNVAFALSEKFLDTLELLANKETALTELIKISQRTSNVCPMVKIKEEAFVPM